MLEHSWTMLAVTVATFVLNVLLLEAVPKGFPQQDTGRLTGSWQADQQTAPFQSTQEKLATVLRQIIPEDSAAETVMAFIGVGGGEYEEYGKNLRRVETPRTAQAVGGSSDRTLRAACPPYPARRPTCRRFKISALEAW